MNAQQQAFTHIGNATFNNQPSDVRKESHRFQREDSANAAAKDDQLFGRQLQGGNRRLHILQHLPELRFSG